MKRNVVFRLLAIAIFSTSTLLSTIFAQEKETRDIPEVTAVSVSSGIDLYLTQADAVSLEIEAEKDQLHKIITEVKGNELHIYTKDRWNWKKMTVPKVYLSMKQINQIVSSGGADVYSKNTIESDHLKVISSGGADAFIHVNTKELTLVSSGGADIKVCLLYTSPSPRDRQKSRMPSSA
jgi:hypothetical protein